MPKARWIALCLVVSLSCAPLLAQNGYANDLLERILADDVKKDAVTVAWCIYHLAMRDDLLPRFAREAMPPLPPPTPVEPAPTPKPQPKASPKSTRPRSALGS